MVKLKDQIKKRQKELDKERKENTQKKIEQIDQKFKPVEQKLAQTQAQVRKNSPYFSQNDHWYDFIINGSLWRGFLWLVQALIEMCIGYGLAQYTASSLISEIGNSIGHAMGLTNESSLIDKVNLMFLPTAFMGAFLLVAIFIFLKILWRGLNKPFGRWRMHSLIKHQK